MNTNDKDLEVKISNLSNSISAAIFLSFSLAVLNEILINFIEIEFFPIKILLIIMFFSFLFIFPEILHKIGIQLPLDCFTRFEYFTFTSTTFIFGEITVFAIKSLFHGTPYIGLCIFALSHVIYHCGEFLFVCHCHMECLGWNSFLINHSWSYFIAIMAGFLEYYIETRFFLDFKSSIFFLVLGVGFMTTGHIFRLGAFISAKSNFHHKVQFFKTLNHTLVTSGIYKFSRHPSYFGFFMFAVGSQIILGNMICMVGHAIALWKFFYERIDVEEELLRRFFGEKYIEYSAKTPILIPGIDSRLKARS